MRERIGLTLRDILSRSKQSRNSEMKKLAADTYIDSKLGLFDEKGHAHIITYARNQKKNFSTTTNGTELVIPFREATFKDS